MIKWPWQKKASEPLDQAGKNDLVRDQLTAHGDDGVKSRHVIHFAYPLENAENPAPKADIKAMLDGHDFRFSDAASEDGLVFEHEREVASADFDQLTEDLHQQLLAKGWDYDGWECAVVTE